MHISADIILYSYLTILESHISIKSIYVDKIDL